MSDPTVTWVLRIDISHPDAWDDVPEQLRELAEALTDLPTTDEWWDKSGRLFGSTSLEVEGEES